MIWTLLPKVLLLFILSMSSCLIRNIALNDEDLQVFQEGLDFRLDRATKLFKENDKAIFEDSAENDESESVHNSKTVLALEEADDSTLPDEDNRNNNEFMTEREENSEIQFKHAKNDKRAVTETNTISKVTGDLQLSLDGIILNLDTSDLEQKVSAYLFNENLAERAKVWKLMAKLDDMISIQNDQPVQRVKNVQDVAGQVDDIVLDADDVQALLDSFEKDPALMSFNAGLITPYIDLIPGLPTKKNTMYDKASAKWDMPIKYTISGPSRTLVKDALAMWEKETCIQFKEIAGIIRGPSIVFKSDKPGCSSKVGKKPVSQIVNLGPGCQSVPIVAHEIGHALGFWHEHSRPDRDSYINIYASNIQSGKAHNFIRFPWSMVTTYGVPYDYSSIMHYNIYAFSKSPGMKTMTPKQADYENTLGQRIELSFLDAKMANYHYCQSKCSAGLTWSKCKNGGYKNPNKCSECKCPDGWKGPYCETPEPPSPSFQSCGATTRSASISYQYLNSPGYFTRFGYTTTSECSWEIEAPVARKVQFEFVNTFSVQCDTPCKDYVEVRYNSMFKPGPRFCCFRRPTRVFQSTDRTLLINFRTFSGFTSKGFQGRYKYIYVELKLDCIRMDNPKQIEYDNVVQKF